MPQMAPMNWLTLLIFTTMLLMLINTKIYFLFLKKPVKNSKSLKIQTNWKW